MSAFGPGCVKMYLYLVYLYVGIYKEDSTKMKYSLIDGKRGEPKPKLIGECPSCGSSMIARCGEIKVWHWAHKGKRSCDVWWENETEWHREWKNRFPESWQETVLKDESTGEKHIADVRTEDGFVIEFQYSHINPEEIESRESFYRRMVWVLSGTRRKTDYKRFFKGTEDFITTSQRGVYFVPFPDECFPASWINRSVPVFFDFEDAIDANPWITKNAVWGLLPGRQQGKAIALILSKEDFVKYAVEGNLFEKLSEINKFSRM